MNGKLQPFEPGTLGLTTFEKYLQAMNLDVKTINNPELMEAHRAGFEKLKTDEIWVNNEYQVNIDKSILGFMGQLKIWHLSIKRKDKDPIHDWRDLQAIKNMLVGEQYEAVELYPAQQRVVDTANQYHLWVFVEHIDTPGRIPRIPIGWTTGAVSADSLSGGKQREL